MTPIFNRLTVLIIACLLLCSSNIYCLEQSEAVTSDSTPTPSIPAKNIILNELDHHFKEKEEEYKEDRDMIRKDRRDKAPAPTPVQQDKDDDNKKSANHQAKSETDGDDDDGTHTTTPPATPSDTIVTTIIIIATETPTPIYTATAGNPAKQQGSGNGGESHQVSDPNTSSSSNNGGSASSNRGGSTSSSSDNEPSETQIAAQLYSDQSNYRRLVLAMSIVGSIGGVALITGGFIYARMRMRRKRRQADLEMAKESISPSSPSPSSSLPPPPPVHHRDSSSSLSSGFSAPPNVRFSGMSDDGDSTVIDFSQNPFSDPVEAKPNNNNRLLQGRGTMSPAAPPSLPAHSDPHRYGANYRQNHTLSMISLTTAAALPSAPSAKELDAMARYENPFEEEYGQSVTGHRRQHSDVSEEEGEGIEINHSQHYLPPNISSSSPRHPQRYMLSQTTQRSFSSSTIDLPPPPAYTPSAAPSAPPLYALPSSRNSNQPQPEQDSLVSSRRHSIDSIVSLNNTRPLSLRRGSGSNFAYVSPSAIS